MTRSIRRSFVGFLTLMAVLTACLACTGPPPQPVESTPSEGARAQQFGCPDGRQAHVFANPGRGAFGVTLGGTDHASSVTLPRASDVGVRTQKSDDALFWKAPLTLTSRAEITLTIAPPHYLAYVPSSVWTSSATGVDVDPWLTRELRVTPCAGGAGQAYLGGLLLDRRQPCVAVEVRSLRDGTEQRAQLRLSPGRAGC